MSSHSPFSMTFPGFTAGTPKSISVEMTALPPLIELEHDWRDLEHRSEGSFFVSWTWIGCWLRSLDGAANLILLRASRGGRTVGLALLARNRERRHGVITSSRLRLHATGQSAFDGLHIECNGFLVDRACAESAATSMLQHLFTADRQWDEIVLDGLWQPPVWPAIEDGTSKKIVRSKTNHYIDLNEVRARSGDYLGLLGSKTRSHIRRSRKEYEKHGTIRVTQAADTGAALSHLDGLKTLHQRYWVGRQQPGAFANPFFERFHRRLVQEAFRRDEVQLLAIEAGDRKIGFIYNFVYRGRIYNYQTGFDYTLCAKHNRPGLVSHACAVEFSASCGHAVYDFLAGDQEYKQALGTRSGTMCWAVVQRPRWRFAIEDAMRNLRNQLSRRQPRRQEAPEAFAE